MKNYCLLLILILWGLSSTIVYAQAQPTLSPDEIVHRANQTIYYKGQDGRAKVKMIIEDNQGRLRQRSLIILRLDLAKSDSLENNSYQGDQKFYVYFQRPADVAKMSFLVWKHQQRADDRWLYLPALDLVKRISVTDNRTSFAGSDFFYEDVSGRNINADYHQLMRETAQFYIIKNSPKEPHTVEFSHYIMFIDKRNFIPIKVVYYNKQGQKYRVAQALRLKKIQGYPTVIKAQMANLVNKTKTTMLYSKVEYNIDLPENLFSERYLRKPPRKLLR